MKTYFTVIDGVEEICTSDEQTWECVNRGGKMYSEENGKRVLIMENGEFLWERPAFPHPPIKKS